MERLTLTNLYDWNIKQSTSTNKLPKESGKYRENDTDTYSPAKKIKLHNIRRSLEEELSRELEEPLSPGCRIDPNMNCQFCVTERRNLETYNEYIHLTIREIYGHIIQKKLLYCNEEIMDLILEM